MSTCGAPTKYRPPRPCRRRVRDGDGPCYQHRRVSLPIQRERGTPPEGINLSDLGGGKTRDERRIESAAEFVVDVATDGWQSAVAERAKGCVDEKAWNRLFSKHPSQNCRPLADAAKALLDSKKALHESIGRGAEAIVKQSGGGQLEQALAGSLAKKIPFSGEENIVTIARAIQIIGIALCIRNQVPLERCPCFIALALSETKERVKDLLEGALDDWTEPEARVVTDWGRSPAPRSLV